mgnify:CR=1 FL=1
MLPNILVGLGAGATIPFLNVFIEWKFNIDYASLGSLFAWTSLATAATALLADGHSLCVFPEGTRSRTGELAEFKAGPFTAAIKAGVAVLPVAVHGAGAVLPPDSLFRVRPGTIRLRFGTPIPAETVRGLDRQQLAQLAQARVQAMLEQP